MTVQVTKLGFLGLNVVKQEDMKHHFHDVVGMPISADTGRGELYFACGNDHHALSLHRAQEPGFRHVGLKIAGEGPLDDALKQLRADGIRGTIKSDPFAGIESCIEIADPDNYPVYLYRETAGSKAPYSVHGIGPHKIGHLALRVGEVHRSEKFYADILGFRWSDWLEDFFVFMRCNVDHHSMNFLSAKRPGMFHIAWELRDASHLARTCDILAGRKVPILWGPGRHGAGHNLYVYHRDPDGNIIETFAELDRMSHEDLGYFDPRPYHRDSPQRPKVWSRASDIWGSPPPPGFID
jgi:catechol-2,3-dioxygenase